MTQVTYANFEALGRVDPHGSDVIRLAHPIQVRVFNQAADRIEVASDERVANSIQLALHKSKCHLPPSRSIPKDMVQELERLAEKPTGPKKIARIMSENPRHPYSISEHRVSAYLLQRAHGGRPFLPSNEAIPADMEQEMKQLRKAGNGAKAIATAINENGAHPYVVRHSRISSYLKQHERDGRTLVPRNAPIPESMMREIDRLHAQGKKPMTIAQIMSRDPQHLYTIAFTKIESYLQGEKLLGRTEPIPNGMLQAIAKHRKNGKGPRAIATIMRKNPEFSRRIAHTRIESHLDREYYAGRDMLSRNEPIPEDMKREIDRLLQAGKRSKAIARIVNADPSHARGIKYTKIDSYIERQQKLIDANLKEQNAISRKLQSIDPLPQPSVDLPLIAAQRKSQEFDDIDLDEVMDAIVGQESANFTAGVFDTLYAAADRFAA